MVSIFKKVLLKYSQHSCRMAVDMIILFIGSSFDLEKG